METSSGSGQRNLLFSYYDLRADQYESLTIMPDQIVAGWIDEKHLLIRGKAQLGAAYFNYDLTTDNKSSIARPPELSAHDDTRPLILAPREANHLQCPKHREIALESEYHKLTDLRNTSYMNCSCVWVRRTDGPKVLTTLPITVTPGEDDPMPKWSPTGDQVAYVSSGDLVVEDITEREPIPQEKVDLGLNLTCTEQRDLAELDSKQIGLGLIQYVQDNDDKYPGTAEPKSLIMPYLQDDSILQFQKNRFVYLVPKQVSLAQIDKPAATELGYYDTDCDHIVLYMDGHVRSFPKDEPQ